MEQQPNAGSDSQSTGDPNAQVTQQPTSGGDGSPPAAPPAQETAQQSASSTSTQDDAAAAPATQTAAPTLSEAVNAMASASTDTAEASDEDQGSEHADALVDLGLGVPDHFDSHVLHTCGRMFERAAYGLKAKAERLVRDELKALPAADLHFDIGAYRDKLVAHLDAVIAEDEAKVTASQTTGG